MGVPFRLELGVASKADEILRCLWNAVSLPSTFDMERNYSFWEPQCGSDNVVLQKNEIIGYASVKTSELAQFYVVYPYSLL